MWPLLKAEIGYSKRAWMSAYAVCAIFLAMAVRGPHWSLPSYVIPTTLTYLITLWSIGHEADTQQRTRANALLPLRPRQLAMVELAYVTLFQFGVVVFWIAFLAFRVKPIHGSTVWALACHNGLTLSFIVVLIIHTHTRFSGTPWYKRLDYLGWLALVGTIALLGYLKQLEEVGRYLLRHSVDWSGALACTALWLGLSCLSVIVYVRRRSYLA